MLYKIRTKKKSFEKLVEQFTPSNEPAWILHCGDLESANDLKELLEIAYPSQLFRIGELSPIIAIHGGQGSLALVSKNSLYI